MRDLATYCRWKFLLEGLLRLPLGLILFAVAGFTPAMIRQDHSASPVLYVLALWPLLLGYMFFASAVKRIQAAFLSNCWLRAGPEGLSLRLPWKTSWRKGYLFYDVVERQIAWADVQQMHVVQYKVNGIPFGRSLCLVTKLGKFNFGSYFKEPADAILLGLQEAKARPPGPR